MSLASNRVVVLGCALALVGGSRLRGRPGAGQNRREMRAAFDRVVLAYKELKAYHDKGEFSLNVRVNGTVKMQTQPLHLWVVRPNILDLDTGLARIACDGKTLTTVAAPLKKFTQTPRAGHDHVDTVFTEGSLGDHAVRRPEHADDAPDESDVRRRSGQGRPGPG